jgi:predicted enzyme related to lactoylglutathione lyase
MVFVFDVPDARAVHARMEQAGADIVEAPLSYTSRKLDPQGRPMQGWVFHAFDPDGYLIEVLEAPKPRIPDPAPK